jgi:hypothetical protein
MNTIFFSDVYVYIYIYIFIYSINFFFPLLVALGWGVALAQGLAGLTPRPALFPPNSKDQDQTDHISLIITLPE